MGFLEAKDWHFNIDRYINPYVLPNRIERLPKLLSRFLGHSDSPRKEIGNLVVAAWAFLGAFVGLIAIEAVFMIPTIHDRGVPLLVASFVCCPLGPINQPINCFQGAAAVLEYNAIESPLAQPRNSIIGHILAALVGIGVTKLFSLNPNFENLRWLAGAFACGLASALMTVTKTIYPPAGATALLAAVDPQVQHLGWYLLPLVCLSAALTLVLSLLINNIQRRYPTYWWTPVDLGQDKTTDDIEKTQARKPSSQSSLSKETAHYADVAEFTIRISPSRIQVPEHFPLAQEEQGILEILRDRLGERLPQIPDPTVHPSEAVT